MFFDMLQFLTYPEFYMGLIWMIFLWGILTLVSSALLKWLWNITVPGIFRLREIEFWEAFRLLIITALLFGKGFALMR